MKIKVKNGDIYMIYSDFVFQLIDQENPHRFHIGCVADNLEDTITYLNKDL